MNFPIHTTDAGGAAPHGSRLPSSLYQCRRVWQSIMSTIFPHLLEHQTTLWYENWMQDRNEHSYFLLPSWPTLKCGPYPDHQPLKQVASISANEIRSSDACADKLYAGRHCYLAPTLEYIYPDWVHDWWKVDNPSTCSVVTNWREIMIISFSICFSNLPTAEWSSGYGRFNPFSFIKGENPCSGDYGLSKSNA